MALISTSIIISTVEHQKRPVMAVEMVGEMSEKSTILSISIVENQKRPVMAVEMVGVKEMVGGIMSPIITGVDFHSMEIPLVTKCYHWSP